MKRLIKWGSLFLGLVLVGLLGFTFYVDSLYEEYNFNLEGVEAIALHTYKPNNDGTIPNRGQKVARIAYNLAKELRVPLYTAAGFTVADSVTESSLYRIWIEKNLGKDVIVIAQDSSEVRDTYGEVEFNSDLFRKRKYHKILVVAALPHMVLSVRPLWKQVGGFEKFYVPVKIAGYYTSMELVLWCGRELLPPHSWGRKLFYKFFRNGK